MLGNGVVCARAVGVVGWMAAVDQSKRKLIRWD